jgi:ligand-binding sensor domain-containing protein
VGPLSAQEYSHAVINEESGLAQDFVYSLAQDPRGFLWIGTGNGLTQYDGRQISTYTQTDRLTANFVTCLLRASSGHLIVGHYQGSVSQYNGVTFAPAVPDTLRSEVVSLIEEHQSLWIITRSGAVMRLATDFSAYQLLAPGELQGKIVYKALFVNDRFLFATSEGLYAFQWRDHQLYFVEALPDLQYQVITALTAGTQPKTLWVGTDEGMLHEVQAGTALKIIRSVRLPVAEAASSALVATPEALWAGTLHHGLYRWDLATARWRAFGTGQGFPIKSVSTLLPDAEGSLWVGTLSNGLVKLYPSVISFHDGSTQGIQRVHAAVAMADTYVVATDRGLYHVAADSGGMGPYRLAPGTSMRGWLSLLAYDSTRLLAGAAEGGMFWYDVRSNQLRTFPLGGELPRGLRIRAMTKDNAGGFWLATVGQGVCHIDAQGTLLERLSTETGFIHNDIYALHADRQGRVWFGSHGAGLAVRLPGGMLRRLSQEEVFPSREVNAITEDDRGTIWVATDGEGIFTFSDSVFTAVAADHPPVSKYIRGLALTDERLWYSYRKGVSYIDRATGRTHDFTRHEGIRELETYASALARDAEGNVLVLHERAMSRINIRATRPPDTLRPRLTALHFQFKQRIPLVPSPDEIQRGEFPKALLEHHVNHLTFTIQVGALNYTGPVYYRYRLTDLEPDWAPATRENKFTYSGLTPGTYTFAWQATTDVAVWPAHPATYSFVIQKPYWQKWWFYLAQAAGICVLFGLTYYLTQSSSSKSSIARVMLFTSIFILFDYVQNLADPVTSGVAEGAPIYKTLVNLGLALLLLPIEQGIKGFFQSRDRL